MVKGSGTVLVSHCDIDSVEEWTYIHPDLVESDLVAARCKTRKDRGSGRPAGYACPELNWNMHVQLPTPQRTAPGRQMIYQPPQIDHFKFPVSLRKETKTHHVYYTNRVENV